ncbi:transmembrane 63c (tmem63c), mRNA protein [Plakobranchus ocellatus]|uniref:Transmembrane 63c (Tmem63c), mRNA protein n=1 Tax=Plakobranchus ocellatus TaxID=259542 RepID=A0AAV3ZX83_9GAST|nr:transmembrane 63c (tmem63c), mRNA protein [Plakobranchus ocellatus]
MLCITAITVSYSIPCPLVCPFGLVYLFLKHIVDRYNIFFAYSPSRINKHIHGSAVTFVLWAVILLQFNVVFFTGLRAEGFSPMFIFSCVALFLTLLIFVGRISFGWFRHLKPSKYRRFKLRAAMLERQEALDVFQGMVRQSSRGGISPRRGGSLEQCTKPSHESQ